MRASRLVPALLLVLAWPAQAARLPYGFGGDQYSVPSRVRAFAVADFDEDGRDDVMAVLENGAVLQWHAAIDGTLEPMSAPVLGASARSISALNANNDDHHDIAVALASTPPAVVVLLGAGDGTFSSLATLDSETNVEQLKTIDFDGDAKDDLVGVSPGASLIRSWRNLGGGSFGVAHNSPGPSFVFAFGGGDLDHDGLADLAISGSGLVSLMKGTSIGTFTATTTAPLSGETWSVAIDDLDEDGENDIVVGYVRGPLILWGDGAIGVDDRDTLQARGTRESPAVVGDFDRDGHLDVAATRAGGVPFSNWLHLFPGAGGRNFDPVVEHEFRPQDGGSTFAGIETGDFNGDGEPDLIVAESPGGSTWFVTTVLHGHGRPFQGIVEYTLDPVTDSAAVARRGGDQAGQILFSSATRIARVLPRPDGTIRVTDAITVGPPAPFHLADLDRDGDDDLVVEQAGGVGVALQGPDGSFSAFSSVASGRWLAFADVDGDGNLDMVSEQPPGFIAIRRSNGSGGFGGVLPGSIPIPTFHRAWAAGDWNGDGLEDLAVTRNIPTGGTTAPDSITILLSNGAGAFAVHAVVPILTCAPAPLCSSTDTNTPFRDPRSLASADLDHDGDLDLVSVSFDDVTGRYVTYLNDGLGNFTPLHSSPGAIQEDTENLVLADFDADGFPDVATAGMKDGHFTFNHRLGEGDGQFIEGNGVETALFYTRSLAGGDLDGDRMPELVGVSTEYSSSPNRLLVFYNATPPRAPTAVTPKSKPAALGLQIVSLAPMPVRRELAVRFRSPRPGLIRVEIFDIGGRRILERATTTDAAGAGALSLTLEQMHAGLYWLRLTQGTERVQARVAVVR